jgi:arylsulfatase A-like enzyme
VTPRVDEFARRDGVSFRWAFCQNPVCTPSRCSFMTGWYPHTAGHRTMVHMLRPHEPNLLRTLRREGYFVWWGGKNDLVPGQGGFDDVADLKFHHGEVDPDPHQLLMRHRSPDDAGYYSMFWGKLETSDGRPWRSADQAYVDGACDFLRHRPADQPLVIYLPLQYPHPPYAVEEPFFSMIDRTKLPPRTPAPPGWRGKPSLLQGIAEGNAWTTGPKSNGRSCAPSTSACALAWTGSSAWCATRSARPACGTTRPCCSSAITATSPATTAWWRRRRTRLRTV